MKEKLFKILNSVSHGELSPEEALKKLKSLPFKQVEGAKVDTHRRIRKGIPEIIYGEGKRTDSIIEIARALLEEDEDVIITRLSPDKFREINKSISLNYFGKGRIASNLFPHGEKGLVPVVTAGTSDESVAEEAAITLEILGIKVERIYDVGAAGIHRLLPYIEELSECSVVITVAGMEGALPTIVSSLIPTPVIGVPTSVGYGTNFSGVAPLITMLNSCSNGIAVVNIDNGISAAIFAFLIQEKINEKRKIRGI